MKTLTVISLLFSPMLVFADSPPLPSTLVSDAVSMSTDSVIPAVIHTQTIQVKVNQQYLINTIAQRQKSIMSAQAAIARWQADITSMQNDLSLFPSSVTVVSPPAGP